MIFTKTRNQTLVASVLLVASSFANATATLDAQNSLVTNQNILTSTYYATELGSNKNTVSTSSDRSVINQYNVLSSVNYVASLPAVEQQTVSVQGIAGATITRENVLTSRSDITISRDD